MCVSSRFNCDIIREKFDVLCLGFCGERTAHAAARVGEVARQTGRVANQLGIESVECAASVTIQSDSRRLSAALVTREALRSAGFPRRFAVAVRVFCVGHGTDDAACIARVRYTHEAVYGAIPPN